MKVVKNCLTFGPEKQPAMIYLLLCIISSTIILVVFKAAGRYREPLFQVILINYVVAAGLAYLIYLPGVHTISEITRVLPWAAVIGVIFIVMFFLVGKTTEVSGMTVTSIATKMSVLVPVLFSLLYYHEALPAWKYAGMVLALLALILTVYRKQRVSGTILFWVLPLILFTGNGFLDSFLKFTQAEKLPGFDVYLFNALVFGIALASGLLILPFKQDPLAVLHLRFRVVLLGTVLGLANFGSLFGMVMALRSELPSSLVFILNNTGVVLASTLIGTGFFREKLSRMNWMGLVLALLSIVLLSLQKAA